jgi:hypothetical protein
MRRLGAERGKIMSSFVDDPRARSAGRTILGFCVAMLALPPAASAMCNVADFGCGGAGTCVIQGTWNVSSGCELDFSTRDVQLNGTLRAETLGGSFRVLAASLQLAGGKLQSLGNQTTAGGDIRVDVTGSFGTSGTGPGIDVSGQGGGGSITVVAGTIALGSGVVAADGGVGDDCGEAGIISLEATSGALTTGIPIHATTGGGACGGGEISLSGTTVAVSDVVDARGGASASSEAISITASTGSISITGNGRLRSDGIGQPDGFGSDGGGVRLNAAQGVTLSGGTLTATGKSPNGAGGELVIVSGGDVQITAPVNLNGGNSGAGGDLSITSGGAIDVLADVSAEGGPSASSGGGGSVDLKAAGVVTIGAAIAASATSAGVISIEGGTVTANGQLTARGNRGKGGTMELRGCSVSVSGDINVGSLNGGSAGSISVVGSSLSLNAGSSVLAIPCHAMTCIALQSPSGTAIIDPGATVQPAASLVVDPTAPACGAVEQVAASKLTERRCAPLQTVRAPRDDDEQASGERVVTESRARCRRRCRRRRDHRRLSRASSSRVSASFDKSFANRTR